MSRHNKVNRDRYMTAGRLSPDDLAREKRKQSEQLWGETKRRKGQPVAPWLANDAAAAKPNDDDEDQIDDGDGGDTEDEDTDADDVDDNRMEAVDPDAAVSLNEEDSDEAAQQPQARPSAQSRGKQQPGGGDREKTQRRTQERTKQETGGGTTRGARSANAKKRATPKASGARGTPKGGKAPKARGTAARGGSPQRAGRPGAHAKKTKSASKTSKAAKAGKAKKAKKAKKR